jgi:ribose transport system ATP-binding protein
MLRNVCKSFSGIQVLKNIDLDLYPGEVHCLVGENGAGKSTLIKIISGAYQPDHGEISYLGQSQKNISPRWARENGINTIYQEIDLIPSLSAAENIFLGNEPVKPGGDIDWLAVYRNASQILDDMGAHFDIGIPVGSLKVAYQQMVAIAKALSLNSKVLVLDEPTAVFTSSEVELLFNIICKLKKQGLALVYISHHLDEIFQIGDRVSILRDGELIRSGGLAGLTKNDLVKAMVGREIDFSRRNGCSGQGEVILEISNLSRCGVVEDVSFNLHKGEILGIAGLVGAGRTELARILVGVDHPDDGEITLKGKKIQVHSPRQALALGLGMLPESRKEEGLVPVRPMGENISYGMIEKYSRFGLVPWKRVNASIMQFIKDVDIRPQNPNIEAHFMSGGNQQKVVFSKLLAAECDVMILDEPTRGVDVGARMEIYKLMQHLKEEGKAILMISSDLPEILTQADRILVMAQGRIAGELTCEEASEEKVLSIALRLDQEVLHANC